MRVFINKTIIVAKKHLLKGIDPREVDRYLTIRRFMFNRKWPEEKDTFLHVIQHAFGNFNRRPLPLP